MSTISFMDEPDHGDHSRPSVRMENTYQLDPAKRFPSGQVKRVVKEVLEGYLSEEKYEPELCRQMTKTLSEVIVLFINIFDHIFFTSFVQTKQSTVKRLT